MKKLLILMLAVIVVLAFGCGKSDSSDSEGKVEQDKASHPRDKKSGETRGDRGRAGRKPGEKSKRGEEDKKGDEEIHYAIINDDDYLTTIEESK